MSLRKRAFLANVLFLVGIPATVGMFEIAAPRFAWLAVLWVAGAGLYTLSLRCERCGTPMYKRRITLLGAEFSYWGGFTIPKNCSNCGKDFA